MRRVLASLPRSTDNSHVPSEVMLMTEEDVAALGADTYRRFQVPYAFLTNEVGLVLGRLRLNDFCCVFT